MAKAVVVTDNMSAIKEDKLLVTVRYTEDIENGRILGLGELIAGERYVREGLVPAADVELILVASEEITKSSNSATDFLSEFVNLAGEEIRGYTLTNLDEFSVSKVGITGGDSAAIGNVAFIPAGSTKISVGASASGIEFGKVIEVAGDLVTFRVKFPVV